MIYVHFTEQSFDRRLVEAKKSRKRGQFASGFFAIERCLQLAGGPGGFQCALEQIKGSGLVPCFAGGERLAQQAGHRFQDGLESWIRIHKRTSGSFGFGKIFLGKCNGKQHPIYQGM
jgi:hypothetical protein